VSLDASDQPLAILLIEDDAADALLVREMLVDANRPSILTTVQRLGEGLRLLGNSLGMLSYFILDCRTARGLADLRRSAIRLHTSPSWCSRGSTMRVWASVRYYTERRIT
jgi:hypothetical protein